MESLMGTQAWIVRRISMPDGHVGIVQYLSRAATETEARKEGAAYLGVPEAQVTVHAYRTLGGVPGGDPVRYQQAQMRADAGESEVDESAPV